MSVIPITIFFSLLLVAFFVVLFARERRRSRFASAEHDSLLPLAEERPRVQPPEAAADQPQDLGAGPAGGGDRSGARPTR